MLNWIVWNGTIFDIYTVLILNWVVWNRTVFMNKNGFGINNLQWLMCHKTKPNQMRNNWPIDRTLSGATIPGQSGPGSDGIEELLRIPPKLQHWKLIIKSFIVSYPGHSLRGRVFANGPGDLGSIPGRVIPKTLKMELDTTLLNTQHYKVRFKGKVEQSWEWSSALPYTMV